MEVGVEEGGVGGVNGGGGGDGDVAVRYERDLVHKLKLLRHELSLQQPQAGHCRIEVSREEIFEVRGGDKTYRWREDVLIRQTSTFTSPTVQLTVRNVKQWSIKGFGKIYSKIFNKKFMFWIPLRKSL